MKCRYCTDENGSKAFPVHGLAPHRTDDSGLMLGFLPRSEWPADYVPDPDDERLGTYYCPKCMGGRPQAEELAARYSRAKEEMRFLKAHCEQVRSGALAAVLRWMSRGVEERVVRQIWESVRTAFLAGGHYAEPAVFPVRPMQSIVFELDSTVRVEYRRGQRLRRISDGRIYVLSGFPMIGNDLNQGFSYVSVDTGQEFWRPISELRDGHFENAQ